MENVDDLINSYLDAIEIELKHTINHTGNSKSSKLYEMLAYHMGWLNDANRLPFRGKRIRPLLVLLACTAAGGDWRQALPGATAVELIHNFSLIHDDIEDHSRLRRGRATVWKKWGIPQAINAGDAMFALAHLEAVKLSISVNLEVGLKSVALLQQTCLHLTQGQFLDLAYESRTDLTVDDYWPMVEGKTAALMSACTKLGAMAAGGNDHQSDLYNNFGRLMGLAFQVQDDYLGIWGKAAVTGKSSQSDLVAGKITLPIMYALTNQGSFALRWKAGPICPADIPGVIALLNAEKADEYTKHKAHSLLDDALIVLREANPAGIAGKALECLAISIVDRQS